MTTHARGSQARALTGDEVRDRAAAAWTHEQFRATAREWADEGGWAVYTTYDSRRSVEGWPDLFCVRGQEMLALELKVGRDRASVYQKRWLEILKKTGLVEAREVHSRDWQWLRSRLTEPARSRG